MYCTVPVTPIVQATFEPKQFQEATDWFLEYAVDYSLFCDSFDLDDNDELQQHKANLKAEVLSEWSKFLGKASAFGKLDAHIETLQSRHQDKQARFDAREVWRLFLLSSPLLAHAAIAVLSIAASEASVERTFSAQGLVHVDRRSRMEDELVEAEMFVKFNGIALQVAEEQCNQPQKRQRVKSEPHQGYCVEMKEDDDDDNIFIPDIANAFKRPVALVREVESDPEIQPAAAEENADAEVAEDVRAVAPASATDGVERFIEGFVRKHSVTARWRWNDVHVNLLAQAVGEFGTPIRDTYQDLQRKIMAFVRGQ
jgi:hAT family C-terminal dimerisation region